MKKIFLYFAALTTVAVACRKVDIEPQEIDEPIPEVKMITETLTGGRDIETKVTIDASAKFAWTAGDNIAVHVSNGESHKYVFTSDEGASGASDAAATASFTVAYEEGYSRDAFAVFPSTIVSASAANYGQSGSALDVTLPSSYTLAQLSEETSPCPMIATNNAGSSSWDFKQLCGLLRLTVNDIPASTKRLEIDFDGKKVCGDFSIASTVTPISSVIATSADPSHDIITITKDGTDAVLGETSLVLNIPLPIGDYTGITVVAYSTLSGGSPSLVGIVPFAYTAKRAKATKRTAEIKYGAFSVSSTRRVIIAPGNLQATTTNYGATWTWQFAENQWDVMGEKVGSSNTKINGNGTVSANGTVDLFAWVGASNTTWSGGVGSTLNAAMHGITNATTMGNAADYGDTVAESLKADWGETINDGCVWRTLNKDEWTYLLSSRSGGTVNGINHARLTYATITEPNVNGFIMFPDGVTIGADEVTSWGTINGDSGSTKTQCTTAQWAALEAKGCVFLPATGHRRYFSSKWELVSDNYYWSSSYRGGNKEQAVAKGLDSLTGEAGIKRQRGCAVRLVHVLN